MTWSLGFPYPENNALAFHLESVVRANGGVPATIGVLNGVARVGLHTVEINELTASAGKPGTRKLSRRDLAYVCGLVLCQNQGWIFKLQLIRPRVCKDEN